MPRGKGTYGSKRGRPPKKRKRIRKKKQTNGSAARTRRLSKKY